MKQIECLLDFIVKEMCLIYEASILALNKNNDELLDFYIKQFDKLTHLKFRLNKRIQLLKHFLIDPKLDKLFLAERIVAHLERPKHAFSLYFSCSLNSTNQQLDSAIKEKIVFKIQSLFLYNIYLEENSIIDFVSNPHRLFSSLYFQTDIPTGVIYN